MAGHSAAGTTATPSRSAITWSPEATRTPPTTTGRPTDTTAALAACPGAVPVHQTGKPSSSMSAMSRTGPCTTRPASRWFAASVAISSPNRAHLVLPAPSQTSTVPGWAWYSAACMARLSSGAQAQVRAGPHRYGPPAWVVSPVSTRTRSRPA